MIRTVNRVKHARSAGEIQSIDPNSFAWKRCEETYQLVVDETGGEATYKARYRCARCDMYVGFVDDEEMPSKSRCVSRIALWCTCPPFEHGPGGQAVHWACKNCYKMFPLDYFKCEEGSSIPARICNNCKDATKARAELKRSRANTGAGPSVAPAAEGAGAGGSGTVVAPAAAAGGAASSGTVVDPAPAAAGAGAGAGATGAGEVIDLTHSDPDKSPPQERSKSEDKTCCICMERPTNTALHPCGHLLCSQCVVAKCPICRVPTKSRLRIYF